MNINFYNNILKNISENEEYSNYNISNINESKVTLISDSDNSKIVLNSIDLSVIEAKPVTVSTTVVGRLL